MRQYRAEILAGFDLAKLHLSRRLEMRIARSAGGSCQLAIGTERDHIDEAAHLQALTATLAGCYVPHSYAAVGAACEDDLAIRAEGERHHAVRRLERLDCRLRGGGVPNPNHQVAAARGDEFAIGTDDGLHGPRLSRGIGEHRFMLHGRTERLPGGDIPEPCFVEGDGDELFL